MHKQAQIKLLLLAEIAIGRHTLVKDLNAFDLNNAEFFNKRKQKRCLTQWHKRRHELLLPDKHICKVCDQLMEPAQMVELHHMVPNKLAASDSKTNLIALHGQCDPQVTLTKDPVLMARFVKLGLIPKKD